MHMDLRSLTLFPVLQCLKNIMRLHQLVFSSSSSWLLQLKLTVCSHFLITSCFYRYPYWTGARLANLISDPPILDGSTCPHTVVRMTCTGQEVPFLSWFVDGIEIARYNHRDGDSLPLHVDYGGSLGSIQITMVESSPNTDLITAVSILTTNMSVLQHYGRIRCGSNEVPSNTIRITITVQGIVITQHACTESLR
jgi:hypothetical protein